MGEGLIVHQKAMKTYQQEMKILKKKTSATSNIFRAVITDLKLGAAARHFETLISFLACCRVGVGAIDHSRKNFNDTLYCLEITVNGRINVWLNHPLPSTQLPPQIWATVEQQIRPYWALPLMKLVFPVRFLLLPRGFTQSLNECHTMCS